jgi:ABC-type dipeptide/oligopeptide/nickel transport system permease subunit
LTYISIFYLAGIFAPVLDATDVIQPYTKQNLEEAIQGPTWSHPFGTDRLGRDQLSRVIWGAQTTVVITVASTITGGLILTVGLGLLSGYLAGTWVDSAIMRVGDVLISLPSFLMMVIINATMKDQVRHVARSIGTSQASEDRQVGRRTMSSYLDAIFLRLGWRRRIIRSQVLALRGAEFILAAPSLGASTSRIRSVTCCLTSPTSSSSACL